MGHGIGAKYLDSSMGEGAVGREDCGADAMTYEVVVEVCCSVLQCVAVCCSVLQCVAVCCSVL